MSKKTRKNKAQSKQVDIPAKPGRATAEEPEPFAAPTEKSARNDFAQTGTQPSDDVIAPDGSPSPKKDPTPLL